MSEFWTFYLHEHANGTNRALHLAGTSLAAICIVLAIILTPWFLLVGLLIGYAFAWIGHFVFEKNRPATFKRPLASFASDWRMWGLWMTGRLGKELRKHGVANGS
ncbi:MAG: Mpo1-like protein [Thermoplasmatota archaeon]